MTRALKGARLAIEDRTARLTVLIDPRKKALLERICAEQDTTPSQVVRQLIRRYIEDQTGTSWSPEEPAVVERRTVKRR